MSRYLIALPSPHDPSGFEIMTDWGEFASRSDAMRYYVTDVDPLLNAKPDRWIAQQFARMALRGQVRLVEVRENGRVPMQPHPSIPGRWLVRVGRNREAGVWRHDDGRWSWTAPDRDVRGGYKSALEAAEAAMAAHKRKPAKSALSERGARMQRYAVRHFGVTSDPLRAGYILRDGRLLNLSRYGYGRDLDHRQVGMAFPESLEFVGGTEGMHEFMRETGAIRLHVSDEYVGADLDDKGAGIVATRKQIETVRCIAQSREIPRSLVVDLGNGEQWTTDSVQEFMRRVSRSVQ